MGGAWCRFGFHRLGKICKPVSGSDHLDDLKCESDASTEQVCSLGTACRSSGGEAILDGAAFLSLEPLRHKQRVPTQMGLLACPTEVVEVDMLCQHFMQYTPFEGKLCLEMVAKEMHLLDSELNNIPFAVSCCGWLVAKALRSRAQPDLS